jgi:hypothetical protein
VPERQQELEFDPLADWLLSVSGPGWTWFVKVLSANDTYAKSNVHQAGPHIGKDALRYLFPRLTRRADRAENPDKRLPAVIGMGRDEIQIELRLVWYNSKRLGQSNGRDEARITGWGGKESSVVSPEAPGSLAVFAFHRTTPDKDADELRVWVSRHPDDEDRITDRVGPVEPGKGILVTPTGLILQKDIASRDRPCRLKETQIPKGWRLKFPSGQALIEEVAARLGSVRTAVEDDRLLRRRVCEYAMFRSVEEFHVLPRLAESFGSVDLFVEFAHSVTNRRKSRSGRSLELQLAVIFDEERLPYAAGQRTEGYRKPDFIFPSIEKYWNEGWSDDRLRMLGAKTTVKDRWRQILNEARRIERKHLLTLQEGVSKEQFSEMHEEGVVLVVPRRLHTAYPESIRPKLLTLSQFIAETRRVCGSSR